MDNSENDESASQVALIKAGWTPYQAKTKTQRQKKQLNGLKPPLWKSFIIKQRLDDSRDMDVWERMKPFMSP